MGDEDFILPVLPEYQPCWLSYLGAVSGVLRSLGKSYGIDQVGGYSGWSFLVNVMKENLCPSGPTAHKAYGEIVKGTESLGFNISGINQPDLLSEEEEKTIDREVLLKRFFTQVKEDIMKLKTPAIVWGVPIPEYGIVYGFEGESYIVSSYRSLHNQPENPIKYNELQAPGGLHAFYFTDENEGITDIRNKEAIERAIKMAKGNELTHFNYVAGPEAFIQWAKLLENKNFDDNSYHGNSYVAACTREGLFISGEFLYGLSVKYASQPIGGYLNGASKLYQDAADLMKEFTIIFPFGLKGDLEKEKCIKGAGILREIKTLVINAIEQMEKAIISWEHE